MNCNGSGLLPPHQKQIGLAGCQATWPEGRWPDETQPPTGRKMPGCPPSRPLAATRPTATWPAAAPPAAAPRRQPRGWPPPDRPLPCRPPAATRPATGRPATLPAAAPMAGRPPLNFLHFADLPPFAAFCSVIHYPTNVFPTHSQCHHQRVPPGSVHKCEKACTTERHKCQHMIKRQSHVSINEQVIAPWQSQTGDDDGMKHYKICLSLLAHNLSLKGPEEAM